MWSIGFVLVFILLIYTYIYIGRQVDRQDIVYGKKKRKKEMALSVSDEISREVNSRVNRVKDYDIEDIDAGGSGSGSSEIESGDESGRLMKTAHYVDVGRSKLRDGLDMGLDDEKYGGKVGSRDALFNSDSEEEGENPSSESESPESFDESELSGDTDESSVSGTENDIESESENNDDNDNDNTVSMTKRERLAHLIQHKTRLTLNGLSQTTQRDAAKGYCILQQSKLFDSIIDTRIKLQKAVAAANELPLSAHSWNELIDNAEDSKKIEKLLRVNSELLDTVFHKLVNFRTKFQAEDHIYANRDSKSSGNDNKNNKKKRQRSSSELEQKNDELNTNLKRYRSAVLSKWSSKIQAASGNAALSTTKFKAINQPADIQVENQLADMSRLVKRTMLNRRNVTPLNFESDLKAGRLKGMAFERNQEEREEEEEEEEEEFEDIPKNYDPRKKGNANNVAGALLGTAVAENPYIFDDEDFYRVLLNDLIDKKISGTNTLQDSESIIRVTAKSGNSNNNKLNRNIDTRASKGRKLNYSIQQPLANYEAPTGTGYRWSDEQIDEFFAGLLGRKINFNEEEEESEGEEGAMGEPQQEELNAIKDDDIQIFG